MPWWSGAQMFSGYKRCRRLRWTNPWINKLLLHVSPEKDNKQHVWAMFKFPRCRIHALAPHRSKQLKYNKLRTVTPLISFSSHREWAAQNLQTGRNYIRRPIFMRFCNFFEYGHCINYIPGYFWDFFWKM